MNPSSDKDVVPVTHPSRLLRWKLAAKSFGLFMYNPETKECIGRDGASWAKVSVCYMVFYAGLASFFIALMGVFLATMSFKVPTYYNEKSVMGTVKRINPGLGFRPQIDPEDSLIAFNVAADDDQQRYLVRSLNLFLDTYYERNPKLGIEDCYNREASELQRLFNQGFFCSYNYTQVLEGTTCSPNKNFGYSEGPCVAVKINRIYGWRPQSYQEAKDLPPELSNITAITTDEILTKNVFIKCQGEYSSDMDAYEDIDVSYYSPGFKQHGISSVGIVPNYYFPYQNQDGYESPIVFVHFRNAPKYQLINILCKAYAANIDSVDKLNLRGMTQVQIFVKA